MKKNERTLYQILEVEETADAAEIKAAYRRLSRQYHPDSPSGNEDRFKEISNAYSVLSDADKKIVYDFDLRKSRESEQLQRESTMQYQEWHQTTPWQESASYAAYNTPPQSSRREWQQGGVAYEPKQEYYTADSFVGKTYYQYTRIQAALLVLHIIVPVLYLMLQNSMIVSFLSEVEILNTSYSIGLAIFFVFAFLASGKWALLIIYVCARSGINKLLGSLLPGTDLSLWSVGTSAIIHGTFLVLLMIEFFYLSKKIDLKELKKGILTTVLLSGVVIITGVVVLSISMKTV